MSENSNNHSKPVFPKVFTQCPNCGSEQRISQMIADDLIAEGRATPKLRAWLFAHGSIIQPDKPSFSAPIVKWALYICYNCGTLYCIQVDVGTAMKQAGPPPGDSQLYRGN